jgi:hypothetical protein
MGVRTIASARPKARLADPLPVFLGASISLLGRHLLWPRISPATGAADYPKPGRTTTRAPIVGASLFVGGATGIGDGGDPAQFDGGPDDRRRWISPISRPALCGLAPGVAIRPWTPPQRGTVGSSAFASRPLFRARGGAGWTPFGVLPDEIWRDAAISYYGVYRWHPPSPPGCQLWRFMGFAGKMK